MDIWAIIGIVALIIGLAIGTYIGILEKRERDAILEQANDNKYIGTKQSQKFHYYTCRHVKRKYRAGKKFDITFPTFKEARDKGYEPCQQCIR